MSTQECLQILDPHITAILVIYTFSREAFQLCQEEKLETSIVESM